MNTFGKRLYHARMTAHERCCEIDSPITMGELADWIGVGTELIFQEENDRNKLSEMSALSLIRAAEYLKCSFLWLATGQGQMLNDDNRLIELLEQQVGQPFYFPDEIGREEPSSEMRLNVPDNLLPIISPAAFYTVVTDNGMQPKMSSGDLVLVDAARKIEVGSLVIVQVSDYQLPVVRCLVECDGQGGSTYQLQSLNEAYAQRSLPSLEHVFGVVMEVRSFPMVGVDYQDRVKASAFDDKVVSLVR